MDIQSVGLSFIRQLPDSCGWLPHEVEINLDLPTMGMRQESDCAFDVSPRMGSVWALI